MTCKSGETQTVPPLFRYSGSEHFRQIVNEADNLIGHIGAVEYDQDLALCVGDVDAVSAFDGEGDLFAVVVQNADIGVGNVDGIL